MTRSERWQEAKATVLEHGGRRTWRQRIRGGEAVDYVPADFDPRALEQGVFVELEHTDDPLTALEIAMDHLVEDDRYYAILARVHAENPGLAEDDIVEITSVGARPWTIRARLRVVEPEYLQWAVIGSDPRPKSRRFNQATLRSGRWVIETGGKPIEIALAKVGHAENPRVTFDALLNPARAT
jgi:hypothetical protein